MESTQKTARLAGLLYVLLAITGAYGMVYVPSAVYVAGNAPATATNLLANEGLFRSGMVGNLISQTVFVWLVLVLYRLFSHIDAQQARLMVCLVVVAVPIAFVLEMVNFAALMVAKGELASPLSPGQRQESAMALLNLREQGNRILAILWGLWLIPFGQLAWRSGFIPRLFGALLIVGGVAYVLDALVFLLFPAYANVVQMPAMICYSVAEVAAMCWLLIKGARHQPTYLPA